MMHVRHLNSAQKKYSKPVSLKRTPIGETRNCPNYIKNKPRKSSLTSLFNILWKVLADAISKEKKRKRRENKTKQTTQKDTDWKGRNKIVSLLRT